MVVITWFGHSMWKFRSDHFTVIVDPFTDIGYPMPLHETADVVVSTHDHFDHNNFSAIEGEFVKITKEGHYEFDNKKVIIDTIQVWHDKSKGKERGENLLVRIEMGGLTLLHCGDLGHIPDEEVIQKIGKIDLLFVPVGGIYTIDGDEAKQLVDILKPHVVFPMHYWTPVVNFKLEKPQKFLSHYNEYEEIEFFHTNETILDRSYLPKFQIYMFLRYA